MSLGTLSAKIAHNSILTVAEFMVIKGESSCLLSFSTSKALKLVENFNQVKTIDERKNAIYREKSFPKGFLW